MAITYSRFSHRFAKELNPPDFISSPFSHRAHGGGGIPGRDTDRREGALPLPPLPHRTLPGGEQPQDARHRTAPHWQAQVRRM